MAEQPIEIFGEKFGTELFKDGFKSANGPNACTANCCRHGVYLDPSERDRILAKADLVEKYFDESQNRDHGKWFDNTEEVDRDFPSGKCVSTEVFSGKCVFLDRKGRCSLQVTEMEESLPRFSLKPYFCVLFPVVKVDGVYQYDDFCSGEADCCTASSAGKRAMVEICSVELEFALGKSRYAELLEYYHSNFSDGEKRGAMKNV